MIFHMIGLDCHPFSVGISLIQFILWLPSKKKKKISFFGYIKYERNIHIRNLNILI